MRDIRTLDLNLLRALDALLDERSVTRAADRLALTQPAVSGMLTRLRESFGDPLFLRSQRGVVPTLRALELAGPVKRILDEIDGLLQPPRFDPATAQFTLSVAATDYALQAIMVPFLRRLRQEAPNLKVAVRPIEAKRMQSALEQGELDLVLITPEHAAPDLHTRHLFREHYVCALREGHPDATPDRMTLDRFCALDHALVSYTGGGFSGVTDAELAKLGRSRRVVLSITSFLVLLDILRQTDLITVVPAKLLNEAEGVRLLAPPLAIPGFDKLAAWHDRTHRDAGHRWVRALLFETCQHLGCPAHGAMPAAGAE